MPIKLGPLRIPWLKSQDDDDPYWQFFLSEMPGDRRNSTIDMIRRAPEGAINPVKAELHSPEITSGHIKEFASGYGEAGARSRTPGRAGRPGHA
jgi:hypothetical protein